MGTISIDHTTFPTGDIERLISFYRRLGFDVDDEPWRAGKRPVVSIFVGDQKINVHPETFDTPLRGVTATAGCGDICFVYDGSVEDCQAMLTDADVEIIHGPVRLTGGRQRGTLPSTSLYARDPDGNLLEWMVYDPSP